MLYGQKIVLLVAMGLAVNNLAAEESAAVDNAEAENPPGLSPVYVSGEQEPQQDFITQDQAASTGKISVSIQDTPASIAVVEQQFIQQTGAKNVEDALHYSSGVYAGNFGFDTRGDWSYVRGLDVSNYLDGLRSSYGYYNSTRPNVYALEKVEVLKGPSSVLYGQAELGGIVNAVSKLPEANSRGEIWAQLGSYQRKQLATDLTGPLTDDGKWLYRLVALKRDSDTQVDHVADNGYVIAPSLTWQPTDQTSLTLLLNMQENNGGISAQFLPSRGTIDAAPLGKISTDRFVGEPHWDRYDRERNELTAFLQHQINEQWKLDATMRSSHSNTQTREHWVDVGAPVDDLGNTTRTLYMVDRKTQIFNMDVRVEGKFSTGIAEHTLVLGVDSQDAKWKEGNYFYGYGAGGPINLYNPQYGFVNYSALSPEDRPDNEIRQKGLYLMDHIEVENVIMSAALRRDDSGNTIFNTDGSKTKSEDNVTSGRLGFMYRFPLGVSPYVSYAEAFVPNLGSDGTPGGTLDPTTGEQKEAGFKYLSADKNLSLAYALFEIEEESRITRGDIPGSVKQLGAVVDGWELELKKNWQDLQVLFNYTELEAEDDATEIRLPYVAEKLASLWAKYESASSGYRVGFGARYTGDSVGSGGKPEVSGQTLYDLMLGYVMDQWEFSLNGKNITDKEYISWCRGSGLDCGYGERRNFSLNAWYRF